MTTACDMRYCTEDAYFQVKEVDVGLAADVGTLQRLPKVIAMLPYTSPATCPAPMRPLASLPHRISLYVYNVYPCPPRAPKHTHTTWKKVIGSASLVRELCFTARKMGAAEALSSGLVS